AALTAVESGSSTRLPPTMEILGVERLTYRLPRQVLTMRSRRSQLEKPETYGSPGWISATSRTGTSITEARLTAAPHGRARRCSRPSWAATVTSSSPPRVSAFRLAYFDMDIDSQSHTQVAWGEGFNWL